MNILPLSRKFLTTQEAEAACAVKYTSSFDNAAISINHVSENMVKKLQALGFSVSGIDPYVKQLRVHGNLLSMLYVYSANPDIDTGDDEELFLQLAAQSKEKGVCVLYDAWGDGFD